MHYHDGVGVVVWVSWCGYRDIFFRRSSCIYLHSYVENGAMMRLTGGTGVIDYGTLRLYNMVNLIDVKEYITVTVSPCGYIVVILSLGGEVL